MPEARTVSDLMRRRFIALEPSDSVEHAGELMDLARVRVLPVVEEGRLRGVLSRRELLAMELASALQARAGRAWRALRLQSIGDCVGEVASVTPDAPLDEAARRILQGDAGFVPVVDADGAGARLVGVLTESDLLREAFREA